MLFICGFSFHRCSYTSSNTTAKSRFLGSSRFRVVGDELIEKKDSRQNPESTKKAVRKSRKTIAIEVPESELKSIEMPVKDEKMHFYRLNKTKVKRKCYVMSRLEKSKKFLAFYSISFPQGLTDQIAYKVFNTWLTRCRQNAGLNSYLWVAERQKNGTIHFHLLTND